LLRIAAEIAGTKGEKTLTKKHINLAAEQLQKDRIETVLSSISYQLRVVLGSFARISYVNGQEWVSTSAIYEQYCKTVQEDIKTLSYRRVSELLTELENAGIADSKTRSKGRHGYGTQFRLVVSP